jgi:hypothetical protein
MQFTLRVLQRRSHQGVLWPILETPLHAETALNLRIGPPLILDYPRFGSCARFEPQQGLSSTVIPDDRNVETVLIASRTNCVCCHLPNIALFQIRAMVRFSVSSNHPYTMRGVLEYGRLRARRWVANAGEETFHGTR